jgi:hypothetical protein
MKNKIKYTLYSIYEIILGLSILFIPFICINTSKDHEIVTLYHNLLYFFYYFSDIPIVGVIVIIYFLTIYSLNIFSIKVKSKKKIYLNYIYLAAMLFIHIYLFIVLYDASAKYYLLNLSVIALHVINFFFVRYLSKDNKKISD